MKFTVGYGSTLSVLLTLLACSVASAQTAAPIVPAVPSVIPPVVLQGCSIKVRARRASVFANATRLTAISHGNQVLGFNLSFVNTTDKVAKIVMIRIGETDFAKIGTFSPGANIAWRVAARAGDCSIRAVRFADGSEWSAPPEPLGTSDP